MTTAEATSAPRAPSITITPVTSSNVAGVGYDPVTQTLAVQFKSGSGKVYHYSGVGPELYKELGEAGSVGRFISANIVGKFKTATVEAPKQ